MTTVFMTPIQCFQCVAHEFELMLSVMGDYPSDAVLRREVPVNPLVEVYDEEPETPSAKIMAFDRPKAVKEPPISVMLALEFMAMLEIGEFKALEARAKETGYSLQLSPVLATPDLLGEPDHLRMVMATPANPFADKALLGMMEVDELFILMVPLAIKERVDRITQKDKLGLPAAAVL